MTYAYDDFIDKLVKHVIDNANNFGKQFNEHYGELIVVLKLESKEYADSNLFDFALSLQKNFTKNANKSKLLTNLKKDYKIYLKHRM